MTEAAFPAGGGHPRATAGAGRDLVATAAVIGAVAVGATILEAAIIPGIVIGGAAVLVYKNIPGLHRLPLQALGSLFGRRVATPPGPRRRTGSLLARAAQSQAQPSPRFAGFEMKQAVMKTITFRVIVTSLDFTTNYIVIGELATAAGLSAFSLVVGPVFYFAHEAAWSRYGPDVKRKPGPWSTAIRLPVVLPGATDGSEPEAKPKGFTISRALAKTITFRTIATTMDFTMNYVVVGDLATAVLLSATGFVLGPFVYLGHEMVWDRYGVAAQPSHGATVNQDGSPA